MDKKECTVSWCDTKFYAKGYCRYHYRKAAQGLNPEEYRSIGKITDPEERFKARTEWSGECLIWTAGCDSGGYGVYSEPKPEGGRRLVRVHRYAWERARGPIPEGALIDHACRNRRCANIDHLRLATKSTNGQNLSGPRSNSTTGVRNVQWDAKRQEYFVVVNLNGKAHHGGFFTNLDEAAEAARALRERLFGEFAGEG